MKETTVLIIGGGATGSGILRDLSMRGVKALLLEQGCLCYGTSSRFHGLLHSGARYAVSDNEAAAECIEENMILRKIGKQCVRESEGFFALTEEDDPSYVDKWVAGCAKAGIKTSELSVEEARRQEPALSPRIQRVFEVPDGSIDGFRLVMHNIMSARRYGGEALLYHEVVGITVEGGKVTGVDAVNKQTGEKVHINCEILVNASGSWSAKIAGMAGLEIPVTPDKGTLIIFNHRISTHVVNRLHKSSDGDIFVPNGSVTLLGTTSIKTKDPGDMRPSTAEVLKLMAIGRPVFPELDNYRILRVFAGTRPLYTPSNASGRSASRGFRIEDHASEGLEGFVTIFGGKFTTYRLMAEKVSDVVCRKLGNTAVCRTAEEPIIPDASEETRRKAAMVFMPSAVKLIEHRLGNEFEAAIDHAAKFSKNPLLCECEMVSLAEVDYIARDPQTKSINDIRLRTRLGMGTCQGTFCTLRCAAALVERRVPYENDPLGDMHRFVNERWKGVRDVYWGRLAREMDMTRTIYCEMMQIDGEAEAKAACKPAVEPPKPTLEYAAPTAPAIRTSKGSDLVVVGAGLAGMTAALAAAKQGKRVTVLSDGAGCLNVGTACIDVLGSTCNGPVLGNPLEAFGQLAASHPYNVVGKDGVKAALTFLAQVCEEANWKLSGLDAEGNVANSLIPTAIGTMKVTGLIPASLEASALGAASKVLICGIEGIRDCTPGLAAFNLAKQPGFADKKLDTLWLASPAGNGYRTQTAMDVARAVDTREGLKALCDALAAKSRGYDAVLLPPVLGTKPDSAVYQQILAAAGCPVIEMTALPPGVTGLRLGRLLLTALRNAGVTLVENTHVCGCELVGSRVDAVRTKHEDGERRYIGDEFIIATGGVYGGGVNLVPGKATEAILGLATELPAETSDWCGGDVCDPQPFAMLGVPVTAKLEPSLDGATPIATNMRYAGRTIGGYDPVAEKSGNGVALATGYQAATLA